MHANVNESEMRLPRGYADSSAEEMEYDRAGRPSGIGGAISGACGVIVGINSPLAVPAGAATAGAVLVGMGSAGWIAIGGMVVGSILIAAD